MLDICSHSSTADGDEVVTITGQFGYIKTPRYPNNYLDNQQCKLKIRAPDTTQTIKLYIIDLALEEQDTECADWLHIFDGHRGATICGNRARVAAFTTLDNWIQLEFHSDGTNQRKGFWLMYQGKIYHGAIEPYTTPLCMV